VCMCVCYMCVCVYVCMLYVCMLLSFNTILLSTTSHTGRSSTRVGQVCMCQNNRHYYTPYTPYTPYTHIYSYDAYIFDTYIHRTTRAAATPWTITRTIRATTSYQVCNMYQNNRHYYTPYTAYTH
jgi:hypothetical protein